MKRVFLCASLASIVWVHRPGVAADCNQNGIADEKDVAPLRFGFKQGQSVLVGTPAHTFTLADLDLDGWLDAVTANRGGGLGDTLSLLWNTKEGTFEPPSIVLSGGKGPRHVAVVDVDEDERPDLAVAHEHSSDLTFLLNRGGRTFEAGGRLRMAAFPYYILPADLDGDQDEDLAVSIEGSKRVMLLSNQGGGQFELARSYAGGGYFTAADFDRDGSLDLSLANDPSVNVLLNLGQGSFKPAVFPANNQPFVVSNLDLDQDGDADLAVGGGTVATFVNQGEGKFKPHASFSGGFGLTYVSPADFDGDGHADLAAAGLLFGDGFLLRNDQRGAFRREPLGLGAGQTNLYMASGDINRDTRTDLVVLNFHTLLVYFNGGDPPFEESLKQSRYLNYAPRFLAGDLDGDLDPDLVLSSPKFFSIFFNDLGDLRSPVHQTSRVDVENAGDFDGDGDLDLVGRKWGVNPEKRLWVTFNAGDGTFFTSVESQTEFSGRVSAADLDQDGDLDLVGSDLRSVSAVLLNRGDATFVEKGRLEFVERPAIADLDGDGFPELAVADNAQEKVSVFLNQKDGAFGEERRFQAGMTPEAIAPADWDLDGDVDLAVTYLGTHEPVASWVGSGLSILENRGSAGFVTRSGPPLASGPYEIVAEDLDGDGTADLAATSTNAYRVSFLLNKSDGAGPSFRSASVMEGEAVSLADFNGDGFLDAVVADGGTGRARVQLNTSLPPHSPDLNVNGVPDECEGPPFHRGDPDGSGVLDLSDPVFVVDHLFLGGAEPQCLESADADNDGALVLTDAVYLLQHLFLGGPGPAAPGPPGSPCGLDPDAPGADRALGCGEYGGC